MAHAQQGSDQHSSCQMASAEDTTARLTAQHGAIEKITHISGVAGASIGIIHRGKVIYTKRFGYRDVGMKQKADNDTMYGIGSCSKSYFVAAAAALVEQGKLSWTEPAKNVVAEFKTSSEVVTEQANIIDLAAHCLGLTGAFHLTFQGNGSHLIGK
jgi:CubicO group peptidase (beta-lactamase class C family)